MPSWRSWTLTAIENKPAVRSLHYFEGIFLQDGSKLLFTSHDHMRVD